MERRAVMDGFGRFGCDRRMLNHRVDETPPILIKERLARSHEILKGIMCQINVNSAFFGLLQRRRGSLGIP